VRALGLSAQDLTEKGFESAKMSGGTFVLIPSSANPDSPLSNKDVRMAMSYAIDRELISDSLGYGFISPAYQLYPGWEPIPGLEKHLYNPDKAKQLLIDAGYPDGFKVTIHAFPKVIPKEYIEAIAGMLRKVGIEVTTEYPEAGAYQEMRSNGWDGLMAHAFFGTLNLNVPLQMYFDGTQFPDIKKPAGFREVIDASYYSPTYDSVKTQAVLQLLHNDVTVIPYVEEVAIDFINKGYHDVHVMEFALEAWTYEDAWLDPDVR
jgi:ABC-type transport system substrate-binding protein